MLGSPCDVNKTKRCRATKYHTGNISCQNIFQWKNSPHLSFTTQQNTTTSGRHSLYLYKHDNTRLIDKLIHLNSLIFLFSLAWKPIQFHVHAYTLIYICLQLCILFLSINKKAHTHTHTHTHVHRHFFPFPFFSILWLYDVLSTVSSSYRCYVYVLFFVL